MSSKRNTAAFFDLDRTLLAGGSGPVFAETLARLGVKTPKIPGQEFLFKLFDLVGESYLVMQLARQASSRSRGLDRAMVQASAELAADTLYARIQPYVPAVLAQHRASGDLLVLATTSPYDLVSPLARRLGFDAVVATRYAENEGLYTGDLDGGFVWGPGKLAAISQWADRNDVELSQSAAYSDSVFDLPMLSAVGRPVAVNPDYRLRAVATLRRWPIRSFDVPEGVPAINGVEPFDVVRTFLRPEFFPTIDFSFEGVEHVPTSGGAIIAANHRSYFDPLAIGLAIAKAGRNGRFMGKKEVFDAPVVGNFARAMGAIRVDRGTGSSKPLDEAAAALAAGEVVVILPQGTIPRGEEFFKPQLTGKSGVARLAEMTGAPIIPLGVWGTENVWPRNAKIPNLFQFNDSPKVLLRFGSPIEFDTRAYDSHLEEREVSEKVIRAHTNEIMQAIMDLLPEESRIERTVTAEDLARTVPGGSGSKKRSQRPAETDVDAKSFSVVESSLRKSDTTTSETAKPEKVKSKKDGKPKNAGTATKPEKVKSKKATDKKARTDKKAGTDNKAASSKATTKTGKNPNPVAPTKGKGATSSAPKAAPTSKKATPPSRRVGGSLSQR
jgi:putative phosphoserine phosphatase / 1-acylglycerol-3-phosphate O-acyltransferase